MTIGPSVCNVRHSGIAHVGIQSTRRISINARGDCQLNINIYIYIYIYTVCKLVLF